MKSEFLKQAFEGVQFSIKTSAETLEYMTERLDKVSALLDDLENSNIKIVNLSGSYSCFELSFTGNREDYVKFLRICGEHGIRRHKLPESGEKLSSVYGFMEGDDLKLYVSFSSTVCEWVKVGTKMIEQDVYDVVCKSEEPTSVATE